MDTTTQEALRLLLDRRRFLELLLVESAGNERCELAEIEEALARIGEGTFGSCLRCGGAIGRQRLRALPEARYCVSCAA